MYSISYEFRYTNFSSHQVNSWNCRAEFHDIHALLVISTQAHTIGKVPRYGEARQNSAYLTVRQLEDLLFAVQRDF
jgi:hypothetical protein